MQRFKFFYIYLFFLLMPVLCQPVAAQEVKEEAFMPPQQTITRIWNFNEKVSPGKSTTYTDLIRKVFPAENTKPKIDLDSPPVLGLTPSLMSAKGSIPLWDLKGKIAAVRHNYLLNIIGVKVVMLDQDRRHVVLVIHAGPKLERDKKLPDIYALAVFNLAAPKAELLAAFDSQNWQKLDFRTLVPYETGEKNKMQFWVAGQNLSNGIIVSEEYLLLELDNNRVSVITRDLSPVQTDKINGHK